MDSLDGCYARVGQAEAHAKALHDEIRAFVKVGGPRIGHELDPETGDYVFYVKVVKEPPLLDWGLRIGDALHNLHSALDNLAWQLALANLGREPTEREAKSISFPISLTREDFSALNSLTMFSSSHVALLRRLQPYHRGDRARAATHTLAILKKLSNIDKHRIVHMSYIALQGSPIVIRAIRDCNVTNIVRSPSGVPLVDGQELARVQGTSTGPNVEVEGKAKLSGRVTLADGTPAQEQLDRIIRSVRHVLGQFEPDAVAWATRAPMQGIHQPTAHRAPAGRGSFTRPARGARGRRRGAPRREAPERPAPAGHRAARRSRARPTRAGRAMRDRRSRVAGSAPTGSRW